MRFVVNIPLRFSDLPILTVTDTLELKFKISVNSSKEIGRNL
jgi:hypothetical protein